MLVFEHGPYTSYSSCGIPYFVAGVVDGPDALIARTADEFRQAGIDVRTLCEVTEIDFGARTLAYRDHNARTKRREGFDELVYATGAVAVAPPVPGAELVEPVRTVDAAERMLARLERAGDRRAVVIGASYLGLEMAEALVLRGLEVTLVDRIGQVMPPLDPDMAEHIQAAAEGAGIQVLLSTDVQEIRSDHEERPCAVLTSAGELAADHVVLSTGTAPGERAGGGGGARAGRHGSGARRRPAALSRPRRRLCRR